MFYFCRWKKQTIMNTHAKKQTIETVLYILNKTGGTDIYHLMKILYFAEQKHLLEWGTKMVPDVFHAYKYGPVPGQILKALHSKSRQEDDLPKLFKKVVYFAGEDAPYVLLPVREPDMEWVSQAEVECLDKSIDENIGLSFCQLLEKSHDVAWQEAWTSAQAGHGDIMTSESIAKAAGASEGLLEYIKEQMEIDLALR